MLCKESGKSAITYCSFKTESLGTKGKGPSSSCQQREQYHQNHGLFQHLSIQTALIVIPSFLNIKDVNKVSTMCLGKRLGPR
jgi:hypothetical protein